MTEHCAKFSDAVMVELQKAVDAFSFQKNVLSYNEGFSKEWLPLVLDPFAGSGKVHSLERIVSIGIDIESDYVAMHEGNSLGDATRLPYNGPCFDMVITSPTFGNRMADHHLALDGSKRHTYTHTIGHPLQDNNSGRMQWGTKYRELHVKAWTEAIRVLVPGGRLILNMSDHVRKGKIMRVTSWHVQVLVELGLDVLSFVQVPTPRMRHGANHNLRCEYESVITFQKGRP